LQSTTHTYEDEEGATQTVTANKLAEPRTGPVEPEYTVLTATERMLAEPIRELDLDCQRWLREADPRTDPVNARYWCELNAEIYRRIESHDHGFDIFAHALRQFDATGFADVAFVPRNGSYLVCQQAGGIEIALHGVIRVCVCCVVCHGLLHCWSRALAALSLFWLILTSLTHLSACMCLNSRDLCCFHGGVKQAIWWCRVFSNEIPNEERT
jgi:hypothetical protein